MAVMSSIIVEDRIQRDGRRSIRERHTDHLDGVYEVAYLAEAGANVTAAMTSRVAAINAQLKSAELAKNLAAIQVGDYPRVTTSHMSQADLRSALRALYRTASGQTIGRVAGFLLTLTDSQLRSLFNVTAGQVAGLRSRLQAKADALRAVLMAAGE